MLLRKVHQEEPPIRHASLVNKIKWSNVGKVLSLCVLAISLVSCHNSSSQPPPNPTPSAVPIAPSRVAALLQAQSTSQASPNDLPKRLQFAQLLEEFHFYPAARKEYTSLQQQFPQDVSVLRGLAHLRLLQGQAQEAAQLLLKSGNNDPTLRLEAAKYLRIAGEPQQALDILGNPPPADNAEAVRTAAEALLDQNKAKEAIAWLEPLTQRDAKDGQAWLLLGRAFGESKEPEALKRGLEALTSAGKILGQTPAVLYAVARAAEKHGDNQTAARAYTEVTQSPSPFASAYRHLAELTLQEVAKNPTLKASSARFQGLYERAENNPQGAYTAFFTEAQSQPKFITATLDACQSLLDLDRIEEAVKLLRKALKIQPRTREGWTMLVMAYNDWNRPQEALKAILELENMTGPQTLSLVRYLEGRTYLKSGQIEKAVMALRFACDADSTDIPSQYWLGKALLEGNNDPAKAATAMEHLQIAADANPEAGANWLALGDASLRAGKTELAITHLEKAIEKEKNLADAYSLLAQALRKKGDNPAATAALFFFGELDQESKQEKSLIRSIERSGKQVEPRLALANFYLETGDLMSARKVYLPALRWGQPPASLIRKVHEIEKIMGVPAE